MKLFFLRLLLGIVVVSTYHQHFYYYDDSSSTYPNSNSNSNSNSRPIRMILMADAKKLTSLGASYSSSSSSSSLFHDDNNKNNNNDINDAKEKDCGSSFSYGVDRSFPIHYPFVINDDDDGGGGEAMEEEQVDACSSATNGREERQVLLFQERRHPFYVDYMEGCQKAYYPDGYLCNVSERERMEMNLRQPRSMLNYTDIGFHKVRASSNMMSILAKFWRQQIDDGDENLNNIATLPDEMWSRGDTYTNHWSAPTKLLSLTDSSLRKIIWNDAKTILEQWTGVQLTPSSMYGVRIYTNGSVLAPHVDRNPLVISAVINVAQDVEEDWPLEVYGRDGKAHNLTLEVGEMILYEGHSVIHGRPFPLKGRYYANLFVHFEPLGHGLMIDEQGAEIDEEESLEYLYKAARKKSQSKCSDVDECLTKVDFNVVPKVPHYILPGSTEEMRWRQAYPKAKLDSSIFYNTWYKDLNAHTAASSGDLEALIIIASRNLEDVKRKDQNGWTPLHEAARGGHVDVVQWLLQRGLDMNERTHFGNGGSPLWWAKKSNGLKDPVVRYLESIGAEEIPPDGLKKILTEDDVDKLEAAIAR